VAGEDIERRLAAIMSADVAGYSRLMGTDEAGTLSALKALRRDVFAPQVAAHKGRVVKLMGDGALVEFPSIVNAVDCAIAVQRVLAERPAEEPIKLRIGVNLGDIIIEGSDIYGDGVNVAARIQEIAEPGEVCISGAAYEQIKGKVEQAFDDLGYRKVKNITEPVRVYRTNTNQSEEKDQLGWGTVLIDRPSLITGRCMCGEVRYESSQPPVWTGYCHCRMCQRANSAAVTVWVVFPHTAVRFPNAEPTYFKSSPFGERGFCSTCGSPMTMRYYEEPDGTLAFYSASLDRPEDFAPTVHVGVESKMPWFDIHDDLPRERSEDSQNLRTRWGRAGFPDPTDWKLQK
jgi:class 3 adenylate cyclase